MNYLTFSLVLSIQYFTVVVYFYIYRHLKFSTFLTFFEVKLLYARLAWGVS